MVSGCQVAEIGHIGAISPQCIRVLWFNGQYVDVKYDAQTGRAEDCVATAATAEFPGAYPGPECSPPGYNAPGSGTDDASRWTRRVARLESGTVLYESADAPKADIAQPYSWDGNPGNCELNIYLGGGLLAPWLPIPDWTADALPNPPYTLTWE